MLLRDIRLISTDDVPRPTLASRLSELIQYSFRLTLLVDLPMGLALAAAAIAAAHQPFVGTQLLT